MHHGQKTPLIAEPEKNEAILIVRMQWVVHGDRQRIAEDGGGFRERDTVPCQVAVRFLCVPLETNRSPSIRLMCSATLAEFGQPA